MDVESIMAVVPIMQFGATGPKVAELQAALRARGFEPGENMGVYDRDTITAIKRFQMASGLKVTGDADPRTIAKLIPEEKPTPAPEPPLAAPPDNVIPLSPQIADAIKGFTKATPLADPIGASVGLAPVAVISDEPIPFYKRPVFIVAAVAVAVGVGVYLYTSSTEPAFEDFEDAEAIDISTLKLPAPVVETAPMRRRPRRRMSAKRKEKTHGKEA